MAGEAPFARRVAVAGRCPLEVLEAYSATAAASSARRRVAQEGLHLDAVAGDLPQQRDRVEAPPPAVHPLAQPCLDANDLAAAQIVFQRAQLGLHCLPQLRRDQAAE